MATTKNTNRKLPEIENLNQMIFEVRTFVLGEYEKNKQLYDASDIEKIQTDDWVVERFIRRRKTVKDSAEMLNNTLKFRHEIEMPRLKESDFPEEFFRIGAMFCYANDKKGNGVVYMRVRMHRKIKELDKEIKKFIMFQIDKMDRKTNGNGMAIIFDCKGAGISNLDMDMLWFLVSSLLSYFPFGMNYILVYDLPWIFSSAWNIVKGWLPAETRNKIKFCKGNEIFEFFDKENLPIYMGGECKINYHHVPKECRSAVEFGEERGMSMKEINQIMKIFKPYLEEADEESKLLTQNNGFHI